MSTNDLQFWPFWGLLYCKRMTTKYFSSGVSEQWGIEKGEFQGMV